MIRGFDTVVVVDFGAQYAQLIARRVREAKVYSVIVPHEASAKEIAAYDPKAIILSGGPASVYADSSPLLDPEVYGLGVPILGICYGAQLIAKQLGGEVVRTHNGEYGRASLERSGDSALLGGWASPHPVWMSHSDAIVSAPSGFDVTGSTAHAPVAAMECSERSICAVQFHPEVQHTEGGQDVLKRFLFDVATCSATWTTQSVIESSTCDIRSRVGNRKVLCALSGGVDSAAVAALVHRSIGDQLTCVYVDTGLMRDRESEQIEQTFHAQFAINLIHVQAADRFFSALQGVTDPEEKRKIIGELFIRIFEEVAKELEGVEFLAQGTLYPDVIESGSKDASTIKSHHNVGGLPEDMRFELVEPLRLLFKDEVRSIGSDLGLPYDMVWRQPFPGPGLAVRIIGEVTRARVEILRAADAIVLEETKRARLDRELWQAFAILPIVRTVGVMGDERTYGFPIVIRAVTSEDAMTADWARLPYELLEILSRRIVNEVDGVNRVVYDITPKPPGTIEWE